MEYFGLSTQAKQVLDIVKKLSKAAPNDIVSKSREDGEEVKNPHEVLSRLCRDGYIKRVSDREYALTDRGETIYDKKREELKPACIKFSDEEMSLFDKFAKDPQFYERLDEVCLPKLYGLKKEKLACLLSLVSLPDIEGDRNRIHVLLSGGPGSGKTTLAKGLQDEYWGLFADSVRISKSTLAGTAKGSLYRPGLLQQADGSFIVIDEIDKLEPDDQRCLLSAMEKGSISVNLDQVNMDTSANVRVLSTCNNTGLVPELVSRFDLQLNMRKLSKDEEDVMIKGMVDNWGRRKNVFEGDFFKRYLQYCNTFEARLPEDREWLSNFLIQENRFGLLMGKDNRNKETLLRLSMAIARLRLEPQVKEEHMKKAIELIGGKE